MHDLNRLFMMLCFHTWARILGVKMVKMCMWIGISPYSPLNAISLNQVQATDMYGAAQPDFFKSETTWDIKIITTHHLYIYKSCVFTQNLEGVTQKISLPRPWEVWNGQGRGSVIFQTTLFKFCEKLTSLEIFKW